MTRRTKIIVLSALAFGLASFLGVLENSYLKARKYLPVCNNLRQIQVALNEYYDRHGVYPVPIAYDSEGEIVGGWRYSLLPHMIALNEAQLSMLENAKWTPDIDVSHYMYAFPDSDEAFSVNTIILGVVNDGRFVCGGPDDPNAILLTTSGDSGIGWGAVGDVEVDDAGEIVKNAPKPLRGECYAVSFSSGVCVVLKKSVPKELLRQFFVSDAESNPLETLKPYLLFVKSYE